MCVEKYCLAQQKAKHMTPNRAKEEPKTPQYIQEKKTKIEMHKKILNSIRFVSVVLHGPSAFHFVELSER